MSEGMDGFALTPFASTSSAAFSTPSSILSSEPPSLSSIPLELLLAEVAARQQLAQPTDPLLPAEDIRPACGSSANVDAYNTPLHVFALVLILILSTLACSFPIVARRFPKLPIPHRFLFLSRHFGTGVLIATAFVHLLPTAFVSLTDPCLPPFWTHGYPAMPGLIAMVAVLAVVGIEMFFAIRGAGHIHGEYDSLNEPAAADQELGIGEDFRNKPASVRSSLRRFRTESFGLGDASYNETMKQVVTSAPEWEKAAQTSESHSDSGSMLNAEEESDLELDDFDPANRADQQKSESTTRLNDTATSSSSHAPHQLSVPHAHPRPHSNTSDVSLQQKALEQQKLLLQCFLLEAGILFHSVFIGMAVSVATGSAFIVLLIAISFHQTFEGLALGSRISAITSFGPRSPKPWLMALAYGTTTPIGQAIGLAIHNLYDPASETGLLMVGFMNAISSGLLLFAGLVELLAEDFLSDKSYEILRGRKRLQACGSVVAGSLLMALVGAWA